MAPRTTYIERVMDPDMSLPPVYSFQGFPHPLQAVIRLDKHEYRM